MEKCVICEKELTEPYSVIEIEKTVESMKHLLSSDEIEYLKKLRITSCKKHEKLLLSMFEKLFMWVLNNPINKREQDNDDTSVNKVIDNMLNYIRQQC